jgi:hypothetical protein
MKTPAWVLRTLCPAHVLICASLAGAQTTNSNNLTVLGFVDATNDVSFGTLTNGSPAAYLQYTNGGVEFTAAQSNASIFWQDGGTNTSKNKLLLDGSNNLTLYGTNGSNGIVLNPNTGGIQMKGTGAGITLLDGTVLNSAANLRSTVFSITAQELALRHLVKALWAFHVA